MFETPTWRANRDWGAMMYFGQDEGIAGNAAGARLKQEGAGKVLCVIQAQGQSQLEARWDQNGATCLATPRRAKYDAVVAACERRHIVPCLDTDVTHLDNALRVSVNP